MATNGDFSLYVTMSENYAAKYFELIDLNGHQGQATWADLEGGYWECWYDGVHYESEMTPLDAIAKSNWREKPNQCKLVFAICAECEALCPSGDYLCPTCRDAQDRVESEG